MSDTITLNATLREAGKKLGMLRKGGAVPAVLYGHGVEPMSLSLDGREFTRAFKAAGENTIIALTIDGGKTVNVLVKDAQMHPLTNRYTHADFFQVRMDEEIEASVPLEFVGEAPAVREMGGILIRSIDEVVVTALPADLPHTLPVDLTVLRSFDDVIKVGDIAVPERVSIDADAETVIALVEAPRTAAELEALDQKVEADVTKVEKSGKPEESAEESAK